MLSDRRMPLMGYTRDSNKQRRYSLQVVRTLPLTNNEIAEVLHKSCTVLKEKQRLDGRPSTGSWIK